MKAYIVYLSEHFDCESTLKILGIYSSNEKAINRVNQFELNELDSFFRQEEIELGIEINNHHNGYLSAYHNGYLSAYHNCDFHKIQINTKEIELDTDIDWNIYKIY